jgi:hypothetical protein
MNFENSSKNNYNSQKYEINFVGIHLARNSLACVKISMIHNILLCKIQSIETRICSYLPLSA